MGWLEIVDLLQKPSQKFFLFFISGHKTFTSTALEVGVRVKKYVAMIKKEAAGKDLGLLSEDGVRKGLVGVRFNTEQVNVKNK